MKRKKPRKQRRQKTPRQRIKEKVLSLAKQVAKERDNRVCQKCHKRNLRGHDCHGSHVIPVSRDGRLASEPLNIKVLCFKCHTWWHEHPIDSGEWFRQRFPDRVEYLESQHVLNNSLGTIPMAWFENRLAELQEMLSEY